MAGDDACDDKELAQLLAAAGAGIGPEAAHDLVAGVVSAPASAVAPDAWMELVAPAPSDSLKAALRCLRDSLAPTADGGLDAGKGAGAARVEKLRGELARRGLDGFVVPRADAHQGEDVPPHAQRLIWLTGFTGSAGLAIVLRERAAIFVDGRYTLQAGQEVDTALFEVRHVTEQPPADWIAEHLGADGRLGYDPWLHTPDGLTRLRAGAAKADGRLEPVDTNPLDAVWPDQPAPPIAPVVLHDIAYTGRSAAEKRAQIAAKLAREGHDAAVLTLPDSIAWLLNVRGGDIAHTPVVLSFALVTSAGEVTWFVDARKLTPAVRAALDDAVTVADPADFGPALDALAHGGKRVLADPASAPAWVFDRLTAAGRPAERGPDPVQLPKACKTEAELSGSRAAHRRDGAAVARFLAWLDREAPARAARGQPVTEMEAAAALGALRRGDPLWRGDPFDTIAGAGEHGAIVHYRVSEATNRPLNAGELFLCDSGGQYLDGTTDITRTVVVGSPGAEMRETYTRVLKGHVALATARFPEGTTGSQIDALARMPLWRVGRDYDHGTGHGVGSYLNVHEGPQRISKLPNKVALAPGMICSNEPGSYKAGAYGIRIENLIAVRRDDERPDDERPMLGFETLTLAPYCRALIDPALLSEAERAWVDAYHARVRETLTPLLDAETAAWLDAETAPLDADTGG